EGLRRDARLLGHEGVARPGGDDEDLARGRLGPRLPLDDDAASALLVNEVRRHGPQGGDVLLRHARREEVVAVREDLARDPREVLGRLAEAEDDLGRAAADRAV